MATLAQNHEEIAARELKPDLLEMDGISRASVEAHYKLYQGYVAKRNEILGLLAGVDLDRANQVSSDVRALKVDLSELPQDLVPLRHVALIELVVRFDGSPRDAVHLEELRLELPGRNLLVVLGQCRHGSPFESPSGGSNEIVSFPM